MLTLLTQMRQWSLRLQRPARRRQSELLVRLTAGT